MKVYHYLFYLTEIEGVIWRDQDHRTRKMVRCLKNENFTGSFQVKSQGQTLTFTQETAAQFVSLLARVTAVGLKREISGPISIVPIPSSGMAVDCGTNFPIVDFARGVATHYGPAAEVVPALRWKFPRDKAHRKSGPRSPDHYEPFLHLDRRPPNKIVLLDDVITSGSQMTAAARFLSKEGLPPVLGVAGARAMKIQHPKMIDWSNLDLEIDVAADDFDFPF